MTALATIAGIALIAVALRDIFDSLFHPGAQARLSRAVMRAVWRICRTFESRRSILGLAGPMALVSVISTWALLLILGFALIYLPHVPEGFGSPAAAPAFWESLHISMATIATLGFADLAPEPTWLRVVNPLEALIGFGLLTASISWLLQIYPVLSRRRSLAYEIQLITSAESSQDVSVERMECSCAVTLYADLTSRLIAVERDLVKFPVVYHFAEDKPAYALAASMPKLVDLAERGCAGGVPAEVRLRAAMLRGAIDDFAATLATRFLRADPATTTALAGYSRDHRHA